MTAVAAAPEGRTVRLLALSLISMILVGSGLGLVTAMGDLGLRVGLPGTGSAPHRINDDVKTSFGIVAVEFVRQVDGVTHRALGGASHGVSGLVNADHAQIQVAVAITNRLDHPISYTSRQFRLLVTTKSRSSVLRVRGGDLPDARVLPHAGIEGHLDFTLPRGVQRLTLQFRDPGAAQPVLIYLGSTGTSAKQGGSDHEH